MSRHNRRRTRGGYKAASSSSGVLSTNTYGNAYTPSSIPSLNYTYSYSTPSYPPGFGFNSSFHPTNHPSNTTLQSAPIISTRTTVSARHWHNRYMAWQARDKRQREERMRLEEDKKRIFGAKWDVTEEDGLAEKMLEYFGGLDFIE